MASPHFHPRKIVGILHGKSIAAKTEATRIRYGKGAEAAKVGLLDSEQRHTAALYFREKVGTDPKKAGKAYEDIATGFLPPVAKKAPKKAEKIAA